MYIKKIKLQNFRNYKTLSTSFSKGINIIYGKNAQGKTNLLESIYVLGITKSHRNFIDSVLINDKAQYLTIEGIINENKIDKKANIYIDKTVKKIKYNDNQIKKISDYISKINIIIFFPEDLNIIKGSPIDRRNYFNLELSQLYNKYYILLNEYNKILKIRNNYLKKLNKKISNDKNYLSILTDCLIDKSINLYKLRKKFISKVNSYCSKIYLDLSGYEKFFIKYIPGCNCDIDDFNLKEKLKNEYELKYEYDIKMCTTLYGPHKDEFEFYLDDKNLKKYGSQGQQRLAILALKLSEIEILKKYKNTTPILLLDDIFSELDDNKKNNLLKYINKNIQTIITTTEINNIEESLIKKSKLFKIADGKIKKIKEVNEDG